jgi:hypothetical protein
MEKKEFEIKNASMGLLVMGLMALALPLITAIMAKTSVFLWLLSGVILVVLCMPLVWNAIFSVVVVDERGFEQRGFLARHYRLDWEQCRYLSLMPIRGGEINCYMLITADDPKLPLPARTVGAMESERIMFKHRGFQIKLSDAQTMNALTGFMPKELYAKVEAVKEASRRF